MVQPASPKLASLAALAGALLAGCAAAGPDLRPASEGGPAVPAGTRQLLLVVSRDWDVVPASVARFERPSAQGAWTPVGLGKRAVLGHNGMAWGLGLHPTQITGPDKTEGDGRSPAGVYRLTGAFGRAERRTRLPYREVGAGLGCDAGPDERHRLAVVVERQAPPRGTGRGACVFIHAWKGSAQGTLGGTALAPDAVDDLVDWLDPAAAPVLVQLPWDDYQRLKGAWGLPEMAAPP